jgi:SAM-dependent methyltransferase
LAVGALRRRMGTRLSIVSGMSTPRIYAAVVKVARQRATSAAGGIAHLDIGAGRGELIRELGKAMSMRSQACDFHVERFAVDGMNCEQCDFDHTPLPYADAEFDLVTSSEVIEHLENFRGLLREAFRVSREGGVLIVTTPNVLNAASRARYLVSGFCNLFGPLPVRNDKLYSTGGHLSPIPFFYLGHALLDAGFDGIEITIDKAQKTSIFWLAALYPVIALGWLRFMSRERRRFKTITPQNERLVRTHFSWRIFVGRTIVVSAVKPLRISGSAVSVR